MHFGEEQVWIPCLEMECPVWALPVPSVVKSASFNFLSNRAFQTEKAAECSGISDGGLKSSCLVARRTQRPPPNICSSSLHHHYVHTPLQFGNTVNSVARFSPKRKTIRFREAETIQDHKAGSRAGLGHNRTPSVPPSCLWDLHSGD